MSGIREDGGRANHALLLTRAIRKRAARAFYKMPSQQSSIVKWTTQASAFLKESFGSCDRPIPSSKFAVTTQQAAGIVKERIDESFRFAGSVPWVALASIALAQRLPDSVRRLRSRRLTMATAPPSSAEAALLLTHD